MAKAKKKSAAPKADIPTTGAVSTKAGRKLITFKGRICRQWTTDGVMHIEVEASDVKVD